MARTRRVTPSLFPFLSVLLCAMGVLIVVITGENLLAVGGGLDQVLEIGEGQYAGRTAVYVECTQEGLVLLPERTLVPLSVIESEQFDNPWQKLLAELERQREERYLVFLIRPEGVPAYRRCEFEASERRGLDVGKDALLSGGDLILTHDGRPVLAGRGD